MTHRTFILRDFAEEPTRENESSSSCCDRCFFVFCFLVILCLVNISSFMCIFLQNVCCFVYTYFRLTQMT